MILVDVWEGANAAERVKDYCELWGVDGTVLLDESGEYAKLLGVRGVPTNVFVDSTGTVTAFGAGNPEELDARADELVGD